MSLAGHQPSPRQNAPRVDAPANGTPAGSNRPAIGTDGSGDNEHVVSNPAAPALAEEMGGTRYPAVGVR